MTKLKQLLLFAGLTACSLTHAAGLEAYSSIRPLLFQELDAPNTTLVAELTGPIAEKIKATTKSTAPVMATVTTIKQFKQEGCSRLNINFKQVNVPTNDGKLTDFTFDVGLNLCKDGKPPRFEN